MSVNVYGINHVAIEVDDIDKAVAFYQDVFKIGEHQFLAMFETHGRGNGDRTRHFGLIVRDEAQLAQVREKVVKKYGLKLLPRFRCDFIDPFGNRVQVVDLHDESLVWLLPYREVQKAGIRFS
jgi:catechol-2,3-dioxygenase